MNFKTSLFVIAVFTGVSGFYGANAKDCGKGLHLMTGNCYACPEGCFCTDSSTPMDPLDKISVRERDRWCSRAIEECTYKGISGYGDCGDPAGMVKRCPDGYTSNPGSSYIGMCYRTETETISYGHNAGKTTTKKFFYNAGTCFFGQHLMTTKCRDCPAGCYCTDTSIAMDPDDKISNEQKEQWCRGEIDSCDNKGVHGYGDCGVPAGGVNRCPSEYTSAENSTSIEDCFITFDSKRIYYKKITCEAGKFLPKGSDTCIACDKSDTYYCPGISNIYPSVTSDQGKSACPSGKKPTARYTDCENADRTNSADNIDSNNSNTNTGSDNANTGNIQVKPGNYLPANTINPKSCTDIAGRKQYCPGGYFDKAPYKQGMYDCPFGGNATDDHKACKLLLTKEQMMYGVAGGKSGNTTSECWLKTNPEDYKTCIYGVRVSDKK